MKSVTLLILLTTPVFAQDVECDVGAISKAFGPIVGDLNECMSKSGYEFLPTPTKRPTQPQLELFCSLPECDKAATSYAGIAKSLPVCQLVLDNQAVPTVDFFSTLCPNYRGRTGAPTTTSKVTPTNTSSDSPNSNTNESPTTTAPSTKSPAMQKLLSGAAIIATLATYLW